MKFETYQDGNEEWRWRLTGENNEIVAASSEGFSRETRARANAELSMLGLQEEFQGFGDDVAVIPVTVRRADAKDGKSTPVFQFDVQANPYAFGFVPLDNVLLPDPDDPDIVCMSWLRMVPPEWAGKYDQFKDGEEEG